MLTKGDLKDIQTTVQSETKKVIQAELKPVKNDIVQIRKDMKMIINFFDKEYLEIRKRVERLEQHLNLPPLS